MKFRERNDLNFVRQGRYALSADYGAGLWVSEVAHLKIDDIGSKRMLIRVEQGKGRKDRNAMFSPQILALLRIWWREGNPADHA